MPRTRHTFLSAVLGLCGLCVLAAGCKGRSAAPAPSAGREPVLTDPGPPVDRGAPCADYNPLKNVYFGDLHVHTAYSLDSYAIANRNDPRDAYRFARGESAVRIASAHKTPGPEAKIDRPLNFTAVTDHSEFFGSIGVCTQEPDKEGYNKPYCQVMRSEGSFLDAVETYAALFQLATLHPKQNLICRGTQDRENACNSARRTIWQRIQEAANAAYARCQFTTFKGYEWSAQSGTANLHRNVLFAGDKVPAEPFDFIRYPTALELWRALASECRADEGCDALTIPHNSNSSVGQMWDTLSDPQAVPFMQRYQTLVEIFQHKGNSECSPTTAPDDEACKFEYISGSAILKMLRVPVTQGMEQKAAPGYVRDGLARGLAYAAEKRQNPLAMGFLGSTDTHNGTPGNVREEGWPGHTALTDDSPKGRLHAASFNPAGITGVWAEQNTRESIFAALKRRETYGTSGTRMVARFYILPDAAADVGTRLCQDSGFPKEALAAGAVPMGGIFAGSDKSKPLLLVSALKDQAPLAQVDFVKVTVDDAGKPVVSIKSVPLDAGQSSKACVTWSDPDFKPGRPTLYYSRILEQPTWRWSHYDCAADPTANPEGCKSGGLDVKIQERAWTSPVFSKL